MKKYLFIAICAGMLSGCGVLSNEIEKTFTKPTFSEQDLFGKKWLCKASYGQWSMNTEEYYEVFPNGTAKTEGKISIQQEGYNFDYKLISKGNWYLDGWYIIEQLTSASVKPNFSPQLKAAMKKNPKLSQIGDVVLQFLNKEIANAANNPARRRIEELTPNQWTTKAQSSYVVCVR